MYLLDIVGLKFSYIIHVCCQQKFIEYLLLFLIARQGIRLNVKSWLFVDYLGA